MSEIHNPPALPCTAILLAGGKSRRMGCAKGMLEIQGQVLWRRQFSTLLAAGPREILISGPAEGPWRSGSFQAVPDRWPDSGPLSGIASAGARAGEDWLLVLAVDLPLITPAFLAGMLRKSLETGVGAVPWDGERYHPLAAVYPRAAVSIAERRLLAGELAMQPFVRALEEIGLVKARPLGSRETPLFANLNTPEELALLPPLL